MSRKDRLIVLDFDGFLVNSYRLLQIAFENFGLDIGDEHRFQHRRKFLKYIGGGKEFLGNLVNYTLPKKKKIREVLTEIYQQEGCIYPEFGPLINYMIENPYIHVGIISRNFTLTPVITIRSVLRNSNLEEQHLDFVIPLDVGVKKAAVLEGMRSSRYKQCIFGGDEIGDYRAALESGYDSIFLGSYGFDDRERLITKGKVPPGVIYDTPKALAVKLADITIMKQPLPEEMVVSF